MTFHFPGQYLQNNAGLCEFELRNETHLNSYNAEL